MTYSQEVYSTLTKSKEMLKRSKTRNTGSIKCEYSSSLTLYEEDKK